MTFFALVLNYSLTHCFFNLKHSNKLVVELSLKTIVYVHRVINICLGKNNEWFLIIVSILHLINPLMSILDICLNHLHKRIQLLLLFVRVSRFLIIVTCTDSCPLSFFSIVLIIAKIWGFSLGDEPIALSFHWIVLTVRIITLAFSVWIIFISLFLRLQWFNWATWFIKFSFFTIIILYQKSIIILRWPAWIRTLARSLLPICLRCS